MVAHIPFVNSNGDLRRLNKYYSDSVMIRISLENVDKFRLENITLGSERIWIDPEIDGYHQQLTNSTVWPDWQNHIRRFKEHDILTDGSFISKPDLNRLQVFVKSVLDKCCEYNPGYISVPQLPLVDDNSRNKINKALAEATHAWRSHSRFKGKLILPLIFSHQNQLKGKTQWGAKLRTAKVNYNIANSECIWAVDSDLSDWNGSKKLNERLRSLIAFHISLRNEFANAKIIAGPYWGVGLVLWAKELCDYPAISPGGTYKYFISGGWRGQSSSARVAIRPLSRFAVVNPELKLWLENILKGVDANDPEREGLLHLYRSFDKYYDKDIAKDQVAQFYKDWLNEIEAIPKEGRTLALYQNLSSAYVLGKQFGKTQILPKSESPARAPERIAELLMLNCL